MKTGTSARLNRAARAYAVAALILAIPAASLLSGCSNAGQGAVSGAGIGALSGLAIGSLSGDAGTGAAIGAVVGGVGGAVVGDQNRRRSEATSPPNRSAPSSTPQLTQTDRDRLALAKFARTWNVSGWETVQNEKRFVSGTAVGSVENTYFLRLDMTINDERTADPNNGHILFASEPGRGLTMTSRFDTSPSSLNYAGVVSSDGNVFTLDETAPNTAAGARRIVIRFLSQDEWVADVTQWQSGRSTPCASFTFTANR